MKILVDFAEVERRVLASVARRGEIVQETFKLPAERDTEREALWLSWMTLGKKLREVLLRIDHHAGIIRNSGATYTTIELLNFKMDSNVTVERLNAVRDDIIKCTEATALLIESGKVD